MRNRTLLLNISSMWYASLMKILLATVFTVLFVPATASASPLTFILAGQSNMVGLAQPIPMERATAKVQVLSPAGTWVPAVDPLYAGGGVGPSITFGKRVSTAMGNRTVRLIPCAYSGSAIRQWLPGYVSVAGAIDPPLYDPCLARTLTTGAHIDGVIFYQGETDAMVPDTATIWASQFTTMVADWRRDLSNPSLPVVFAQIDDYTADTINYSQWDTVQAQQASVSLPGVSMIETDDLPVGPDGIHLTAGSYFKVGRRFANAWLKLSASPAASGICAGIIHSDGSKVGSCFTVVHPQTGVYYIYFTTPFTTIPALLVTSMAQLAYPIIQVWPDHAIVVNYTPTLALINNDFDFVVFPVG